MFTAHLNSSKLTGLGAVGHRKQSERNLQSNDKYVGSVSVCTSSKSKSRSNTEKFPQSKIQNTNREYMKWSEAEKEAVNRQFSNFITKMQCPRQLDCLNAKAKEPALANRTWKRVKFYVSTQINKYKSNICHRPQNL